MRKFILFTLLIAACNLKEQKLDGAYTLVAAQYGDSTLPNEYNAKHKTIIVYKNGYWIAATYTTAVKTIVEKGIGGTYVIKNGRCIETVNFSSDDNTIIGQSFNFNFSLNGNKYLRTGKMKNYENEYELEEVYEKVPSNNGLYNRSLEGVLWGITGDWSGYSKKYPDFIHFKIYAYPIFIWAQYNAKGKDFIGVAGGTYQFDGKKVIERIEYISYYPSVPDNIEKDNIKLSSDTILQETSDKKLRDFWKKIP